MGVDGSKWIFHSKSFDVFTSTTNVEVKYKLIDVTLELFFENVPSRMFG